MSPGHESHTVLVGRQRRAYLWLPHNMTESEWQRMLAWLEFTKPAVVSKDELMCSPFTDEKDKPT